MNRFDLLFEIGTEELPPKSLEEMSLALKSELVTKLNAAGLDHGDVKRFATPRRLSVLIQSLVETQPDQAVERKGPPVKAAFTVDGTPTKAATAFADSVGVAVSALERVQEAKGEFLFHKGIRRGQPTRELLPKFLQESIDALPIAKRMRWGDSTAEFVRPVHWIVLLLGSEVIDAQFFGLTTNRVTFGHRFMAPQAIPLAQASDYEAALMQAKVLADPLKRRAKVVDQINACATKVHGHAVMPDELVNEVSALVEWPVGVIGRFEERFLSLPAEVLRATLEDHQRYFSIKDSNDALTTQFVTIANIESSDPSEIRKGNERVVRPRLADAQFFWDQDRATSLESRVEALRKVTFQALLGSYYDKTQRIITLSEYLANLLKLNPTLLQHAKRASLLAKTDLITGLVGEFPELQGTMGKYYATLDNESEAVTLAIGEQYHPRFASDSLPTTEAGTVIALADKIDTIASIFTIGQKPSGTRDPYALRRLSLGVLRILREKNLDIDLKPIFSLAIDLAHEAAKQNKAPQLAEKETVLTEVLIYLNERLRGALMDDVPGVTVEVTESVFSLSIHSPVDIQKRVQAVVELLKSPESKALSSAQKRIVNLFKKSAPNQSALGMTPSFETQEEQELFDRLQALKPQIDQLTEQKKYTEALLQAAKMHGPIDRFFENVMIMADDPVVRERRLGLLLAVRSLFLTVADLSHLPG